MSDVLSPEVLVITPVAMADILKAHIDAHDAALIKPLVDALDALCLVLSMHHGLETAEETAKRVEKHHGSATANHYLRAGLILAAYRKTEKA